MRGRYQAHWTTPCSSVEIYIWVGPAGPVRGTEKGTTRHRYISGCCAWAEAMAHPPMDEHELDLFWQTRKDPLPGTEKAHSPLHCTLAAMCSRLHAFTDHRLKSCWLVVQKVGGAKRPLFETVETRARQRSRPTQASGKSVQF